MRLSLAGIVASYVLIAVLLCLALALGDKSRGDLNHCRLLLGVFRLCYRADRLADRSARAGEPGSTGDPAAFVQHMPSIEFEDMPPPALPPKQPL